MSTFAEELKVRRESSGKKPGQLARAVGITPPYYSQLESGVRTNPAADLVVKLEAELGLSIGTLAALLAPDVPVVRSEIRTIRIREGNFSLRLLGTVPAGVPTESIADGHGEEWDFREHLGGPGRFLLRVRGVSMSGAAIASDDLVVVEPCRDLDKMVGRVVVASVNGEDTVKRLGRQGKRYTLEAAHQDYPTIYLTANHNAGVLGLVVGLVRLY